MSPARMRVKPVGRGATTSAKLNGRSLVRLASSAESIPQTRQKSSVSGVGTVWTSSTSIRAISHAVRVVSKLRAARLEPSGEGRYGRDGGG